MKKTYIDPKYQQVYEIQEITKNGNSDLLMQVVRKRNVRFYFSEYENYERFKNSVSDVAIIKTQFSDRGWALIQLTKKLKVGVHFKHFDQDLVCSNSHLIHTKRSCYGIFKNQIIEVPFEKFEILETTEWQINGINANTFLKDYGLMLPFI